MPNETRPVDDLKQLARLLTGKFVDPKDPRGLSPYPDAKLLKASWESLRRTYKDDFGLSLRTLVAWHQQEAADAENTKDWELALRHLNALLGDDLDPGPLHARRGKALSELNRWPEALEAYTHALIAKPDNAEACYQRGRVHARLGKPAEALKDYDQALKLNPEDGSIYLARSVVQTQCGNLKAAQEEYERAAAKSPVNLPRPDWWWSNRPLRTRPEARNSHWQEIVTDCTNAIRTGDEKRREGSTDRSTSPETAGDNKWVYYRSRGLAYSGLGSWEQAAEDFSQPAVKKANDPSAWQGAARSLAEAPRWSEAEEACRRAMELDPKDWRSCYLLGITQKMQNRHDSAIEAYTRALDRGATGWGIWAERGYAHSVVKNYDLAIKDYSKVLQSHPDATVYNNLAVAYNNTGRYEEAVRNYTEAIRLNPKGSLYFRNRGNAYFGHGLYHHAVADYSMALETGGPDARTYRLRGRALASLHSYDRAIPDYNEAIKLNPKEPTYYTDRGYARQKRGDRKDAMDDYVRARQINPEFTAANINLANLLLEQDDAQRAEEILKGVIASKKRLAEAAPKERSHRQDLAWAYENRAGLFQLAGRLSEAASTCQKALALRQTLVEEMPKDRFARQSLGRCYEKLGSIFHDEKQPKEAKTAYQESVSIRTQLAKEFDTSPACQNGLAWLLAVCPLKELRDPGRAVECASMAVKLAPSVGDYWNTLGVAHYRAGNWEDAIKALDQSMDLTSGGGIIDWLFLAMAHKQLGHQEKAQGYYGRAVKAMEKEQETDQSRRFRAEAADLLRVVEPSRTEKK